MAQDSWDDNGFISGDYNDDYNDNEYNDDNTYNDDDGYNNNYHTRPEKSKIKSKYVRPRPKRNKLNTNLNDITNNSNNNTNNDGNKRNIKRKRVHPNINRNNNISNGNMGNNNNNNNNFNNNVNNFNNQATSFINNIASNNLGSVGAMAMGAMMQPNLNQLNQLIGNQSSMFSYNYYKYYFRVDNAYVLRKLKKIILPFNRNVSEWTRKPIQSMNSSGSNINPYNSTYELPINDINAPDGYIPLMAIITYIVTMAFLVGTTQGKQFSPQVLIATGSTAFTTLFIEVCLLKLGFYLIGIQYTPYWLDLICYVGYKLIFVVINLFIFTIVNSLIIYYIISISTGILAAVFMIQTIRPYFKNFGNIPPNTNFVPENTNQPLKTKRIFLGIVAAAQIIFIQLMGRYMT